ncbi:D-arabinono-1,4-lactone oxidase [Conexibacter sp. DBS9H8]|uniref:D-arabinono-1,4-lactone oxidase n=1 Tax=Conexibacter sp. DBS9H8 TaxID=2937801 RepID=UPI0020104E7C|nr:D-arabinono-1,4-lactone oxidase [Conexibacter sp. DBS9H8]
MSGPLTNWAGNHTYAASTVHTPHSVSELAALLGHADQLRVLGTRHSFTAIGDAATLVRLDRLPEAGQIRIDAAAMTVTIGPCVTYAQLTAALHRAGLALENLASLPHISVCGSVATATHGSGAHGNLATAVLAMTLLTGTGERLVLTEGDPRLPAGTVHLGLLGIVLELTLRVLPAYPLTQTVYEGLDWATLIAHTSEIFALGYSVSVFHHLSDRPPALWVKATPGSPPAAERFGVHPAPAPRHPIPGQDADACTDQLGVPGPSSERLPHFRAGHNPSHGAEIQSELFVAIADGPAAIRALLELAPRLAPGLLVGELRTVAADGLWLSPQYGRDSLGLHFTWARDPDAVAHNVALIEAALTPFAPRPHWGKVFSLPPVALSTAYARTADFGALRAELDPRDVFVNGWVRARFPALTARPGGR